MLYSGTHRGSAEQRAGAQSTGWGWEATLASSTQSTNAIPFPRTRGTWSFIALQRVPGQVSRTEDKLWGGHNLHSRHALFVVPSNVYDLYQADSEHVTMTTTEPPRPLLPQCVLGFQDSRVGHREGRSVWGMGKFKDSLDALSFHSVKGPAPTWRGCAQVTSVCLGSSSWQA